MDEQFRKMPSVLLLTDDVDLAVCIGVYLEDSYRVFILHDPSELKTYLKYHQIDLLLADLDTRGTGQWQQLQVTRSKYPQLKVIVMSMFLDEEMHREKSILDAADDHIFKPFNGNVLKYKLDQLITPFFRKSVASS